MLFRSPAPSIDPSSLDGQSDRLEVLKNGTAIHECSNLSKEELESAICVASRLTSLRIGDFVAVELAPMQILSSRDEVQAQLKATYGENSLIDLKIQF